MTAPTTRAVLYLLQIAAGAAPDAATLATLTSAVEAELTPPVVAPGPLPTEDSGDVGTA